MPESELAEVSESHSSALSEEYESDPEYEESVSVYMSVSEDELSALSESQLLEFSESYESDPEYEESVSV
eukprot:CAMPEP_0114246034 /NCGR_PEP_ID=MMETSP0058-20121206/12232_1 /TAXON_ID=36894 /ORGANISM="Pyramimonas parkeae, CCMP726" /LENGTH=69 /DNA_ID=CAMNT_0001359163 /DNA_START=337 /DNA_END=546 /DNA_ORIENTATION=-